MNSIRMLIPGLLITLLTFSVLAAQDQPQEEKGFLGIQYSPADGEKGMKVVGTIADSPAASMLKMDDVILKFGEEELTELPQLHEAAAKLKPGEVAKLLVVRNGEELSLEITLGKRPDFTPLTFASADGVEVTADYYFNTTESDAPLIVLCHQAGWSRGEYREIAPKLNKLGFNCLAIDQRSGGEVNEVVNETNKKAAAEGKPTNFTDAEQDMIAALKKAREMMTDSKIILWGSSYSAALALRISGEEPELVDGVLAFAPGEYFGRFGQPEDWIATSAKKIKAPVFITSAKDEFPRWEAIFNAIPGDAKVKFVPETAGNHGSRALWEKFDDHGAYWKNVEEFLEQFK